VEGNSVRATVRITTDGHRIYADAVESAFGSEIDYAMLVKLYGNDHESETRYSPAECIGCRAIPISGNPKLRRISTSFFERQNLTMRMQMRRFTRLTNAFSKKIDNLGYVVALHFMHYNSAVFTRRCALFLRWKLESQITFGRLKRLSQLSRKAYKMQHRLESNL
jgi:hypothetical protein